MHFCDHCYVRICNFLTWRQQCVEVCKNLWQQALDAPNVKSRTITGDESCIQARDQTAVHKMEERRLRLWNSVHKPQATWFPNMKTWLLTMCWNCVQKQKKSFLPFVFINQTAYGKLLACLFKPSIITDFICRLWWDNSLCSCAPFS